MKKKIILMLALCMMLVGCSNVNVDETITNENLTNEANEELKEPILKWAEVYNPNGFNTVTGVISNPNKTDIDITFDLVYYKNEAEVGRTEGAYICGVSSKHDALVWANYDVPNPEDVDDVRMENVSASEAYYKPIDAKIEFDRTEGNKAIFKVKHDKKPTLNNISFLLYNDSNGNKKCDKGEILVVSMTSTLEQEAEVCFETDVFGYTDYEVYYNAY